MMTMGAWSHGASDFIKPPRALKDTKENKLSTILYNAGWEIPTSQMSCVQYGNKSI